MEIIERTDEQLRADMLKNEQCQEQLKKHNLWLVANRNHWQLSCSGTNDECNMEQGGDTTNYEIHTNGVKDIWENPVDGYGMVVFQNGETVRF